MLRIVFAVFSVMLICATVAIGQPRFHIVEGLEPNFGKIVTNEPAHYTLHIQNTGTDTLIISDVSSSCGCTGAMAATDHIPPDGEGDLRITFNPEQYKGVVRKGVSFETNDPDSSHVHLNFTVNIEKVLTIDQEYLTFADARIDSQATEELVLTNASNAPVKILSTGSSSEYVEVSPNKAVIEPNKDLTLSCILRAKTPHILRGTVTIDTDSKEVPRISVPFFALVKQSKTAASPQH